MEGTNHRLRRGFGRALLAGSLMASMLSAAAPASGAEPRELPACAIEPAATSDQGTVVSPWAAVLDRDGVLKEHRMVLRHGDVDTTVRTGRRGFALQLDAGRTLVGERSSRGTELTMIDIPRGCRTWSRTLDQLAYEVGVTADGDLELGAHEPLSRLFEGTLVVDAGSGATIAMIEGECDTDCQPNDGWVPAAAFEPAGPPRPVPAFAAGGWTRDKTLGFKWRAGSAPPQWARTPLNNAAADAKRTSGSRSPDFRYRSGAGNSVRYTPTFPSFCRTAIACASRNMPWWAVWIRPYGHDLPWGMLRWCQKKSGSGCFDVRRVMLHELGHVSGLNHPSIGGFKLAPHDTVMHAITPAKPKASSTRHAFGRCDVATLQRLYDVPGKKAPISVCHDLATKLRLWASSSSIVAGGKVKLTAELRIADQPSYGALGGNGINGRSVKLKYRKAGSTGAWSVTWMKPLPAAGRYESTISPSAHWEFLATFPTPSNEGLRYSRSSIVKVKVTP